MADDGKGGTVETTFTIQVSSSVATLDREFGRGVEGAVVNGVSTRAKEFLIGGDNDQTLNTGRDGDYVFGGRGDDTINLGVMRLSGDGLPQYYKKAYMWLNFVITEFQTDRKPER